MKDEVKELNKRALNTRSHERRTNLSFQESSRYLGVVLSESVRIEQARRELETLTKLNEQRALEEAARIRLERQFTND